MTMICAAKKFSHATRLHVLCCPRVAFVSHADEIGISGWLPWSIPLTATRRKCPLWLVPVGLSLGVFGQAELDYQRQQYDKPSDRA